MARPVLLLVPVGVALVLAASAAAVAPSWFVLGTVAILDLAAGREASLPAALAADLPWPRAALLVTLVQWSVLLGVLPLVALLGDQVHRLLAPALRKAEVLAARRPASGALALAGLAVFPFLPVGAITAALAGRALAVPLARLVPVILAAQLAVNIAWAAAAAAVLAHLPQPRFLAALLAAGLLLAALASARRGRKATSM